jgi:hypothetical protein
MTNSPILVSYYDNLRGLFDMSMGEGKRGYVREVGGGVLVVLGSVGNQLRVVMGDFYIKKKKKVIGACIKTLSFWCMIISSSLYEVISFLLGMEWYCFAYAFFNFSFHGKQHRFIKFVFK